MKKLLVTFLFIFLYLLSLADGIIGSRKYKDTIFNSRVVRINWDTTAVGPQEVVWLCQGDGEVGNGTIGNDTLKIAVYLAEYWLRNGWNGNVSLGNGIHKPVFCTVIQNGTGFTRAPDLKLVFDGFIASRFRAFTKDSAWGCIGLSAGAWMFSIFNTYMATTGNHSCFQYFKWEIDLEGVQPSDNFDAMIAYPNRFGNRAHIAHFSFLGFDQTGSGALGTSWQIQQNIIDTISPYPAYNIWSHFGAGGHEGFNNMTDPSDINFTATNSNLTTTNAGEPSVFIAGGQNVWQWGLRQADTSLSGGSTPPTANAGGPYNVTQANGSEVILNGTGSTAPSGHTLSYHWSFLGYYIGNDKITHSTYLNGESQLAWILDSMDASPHVIDMKMYCGDSIHYYPFKLKVTDNTTGLSDSTTVNVVYRYWNKYPPQNADGGNAWHTATSGDCAAMPANIKPACVVGQSILVTGANSDPVTDANGVSHFTSYFKGTNSTSIPRPASGQRLFINAGSNIPGNGPYCNFQLLYDSLGASDQQPLGDTTAGQIIIQYYCDSTHPVNLKGLAGFTFSNINNIRVTGDYDTAKHLGVPQYTCQHNDYANDDTTYGWMVNNYFMSRAGASFQIAGKDSHHWHIDHCASFNGNFFGFQLKQEYSGLANPGTRQQTYWYNDSCSDNLVVLNTGESYYCFSANQPAIQGVNFMFYNNRALFAGNKSFKVLDQKSGCHVFNNAAAFISINWASAFEEDVSVGSEVSVVGSHNNWYNNLIYRFGNQGLNYLTTNFGAPGQVDSIYNNGIIGGVGPIGFYIGQQDSAATLYVYHNITGGYTPFLFNQAYFPGSHGTNTAYQIQALEAGSLPSGHTLSNYYISLHLRDTTKKILYSGSGIAHISSDTSTVNRVPWPTFVNSGFPAGTYVRQFNTITFGTFGDEFGRQSDQKDTVVVYQTGEIVHWFGKFYQSLINNNSHIPSGASDAYWTLLTFTSGSTYPPNDIRLFTTDFYGARNIGLLDQVTPFIPPPAGQTLPFKKRILFH